MQSRSSTDTGSSGHGATILPWCMIELDWPYEAVAVEVAVTAPRELTIFEWAIERVLIEFNDNPPTLTEVADELGIKAPVFLQDTLESLIQVGAVELRDPSQQLNLSNASLTPLGHELFREGRAACLTEHHGMLLHFDAVTGEHISKLPKRIREQPANPIIDADKLPQRLQEIGLDRVRELAQRQNEPFHRGESQIGGVTVLPERGRHLWLPAKLALGIDQKGTLQAAVKWGSEAQQAWFDTHGWTLDCFNKLATASTSTWANGRCQQRVDPVPATEWLATVERLVPPVSTAIEAGDLINAAEQEVILHAGWLDAPEIENMLARAARRGVRCYLSGAEPSLTDWTLKKNSTPGFVAGGGQPELARPLAVVADKSHGLRIDRVCACTPADDEIGIEAASWVRSSELPALRENLLADFTTTLSDEDNQHLFVGFSLTGDLDLWKQGNQAIRDRTSGIEQVTELQQWAAWAQDISPKKMPTDGWLTYADEAWWAALEAALAGLDGEYTALLDVVSPSVSFADVLSRLVQQIEVVPADQDAGPLCELLMLAGEFCRRWPDFHPVTKCPKFAQKMRACFNGDEYERATLAAVQMLSESPRFQTEGKVWLRVLSASIPVPHDVTTLLAWLEAQVPLKPYLGSAFGKVAHQYLSKLSHLFNTENARSNGALRRLQDSWRELGLPHKSLRGIVQTGRGRVLRENRADGR